MAVLVTRPHPDNEATARALRDRGFQAVLAPVLRFEPVALPDELDADFAAVIATSANALRAAGAQLSPLAKLPLFAVGEHTAAEALRLGFADVVVADGDALRLRERVRKGLKRKAGKLLYLAGADLSRDLAGELATDGHYVIRHGIWNVAAVFAVSHFSGARATAADVLADTDADTSRLCEPYPNDQSLVASEEVDLNARIAAPGKAASGAIRILAV